MSIYGTAKGILNNPNIKPLWNPIAYGQRVLEIGQNVSQGLEYGGRGLARELNTELYEDQIDRMPISNLEKQQAKEEFRKNVSDQPIKTQGYKGIIGDISDGIAYATPNPKTSIINKGMFGKSNWQMPSLTTPGISSELGNSLSNVAEYKPAGGILGAIGSAIGSMGRYFQDRPEWTKGVITAGVGMLSGLSGGQALGLGGQAYEGALATGRAGDKAQLETMGKVADIPNVQSQIENRASQLEWDKTSALLDYNREMAAAKSQAQRDAVDTAYKEKMSKLSETETLLKQLESKRKGEKGFIRSILGAAW